MSDHFTRQSPPSLLLLLLPPCSWAARRIRSRVGTGGVGERGGEGGERVRERDRGGEEEEEEEQTVGGIWRPGRRRKVGWGREREREPLVAFKPLISRHFRVVIIARPFFRDYPPNPSECLSRPNAA